MYQAKVCGIEMRVLMLARPIPARMMVGVVATAALLSSARLFFQRKDPFATCIRPPLLSQQHKIRPTSFRKVLGNGASPSSPVSPLAGAAERCQPQE